MIISKCNVFVQSFVTVRKHKKARSMEFNLNIYGARSHNEMYVLNTRKSSLHLFEDINLKLRPSTNHGMRNVMERVVITVITFYKSRRNI